MPKITILPYSNKWEKTKYRKVKWQKISDPIGKKSQLENKILNIECSEKTEKSRDIYSPSDFNNIGRVWTF